MGNGSPLSETGHGYSGAGAITEVTATEAWDIMAAEEKAILVDVRTSAEWAFVGAADLSQICRKVIFLSWRIYPDMSLNPDFCHQLAGAGLNGKDSPLLFICRSGQRSLDAAVAMSKLGYSRCYNITCGFEGEHNENRHRGTKTGWKASNLPWIQN